MKPLILSLAAAASTLAAQPDHPNVILILADDMGWHDTGFSGNAFTDTPNLDRMAREGVIFDQACASAPNCAPTRACLLTGQYPPRHGVYTVVDDRHAPGSPAHRIIASPSREALPEQSVTLAETLRSAGYATGMFGMWNLGRGRSGPTTPTGQGFDVFKEPKHLGFEKDAYHDEAGRYSPDALTDAALEWMNSVKTRPFFLYLAFHDVHAPYDPKPSLLKKYQSREGVVHAAHAATVEAMDANVGRVLAALERAGINGQTHVIFTSDNGGNRELVAPLNGAKGSLYQGGLRVPAIIRGPGIPGDRRSQTPILSMDWFPTVVELAGLKPAPGPKHDGASLVPILKTKSSTLERDLFWHFPCYSGGKPASAIRSGDLKLIEFFESKSIELYDLAKDPGERHNLATEEPDRAAAMLARLHSWQESVNAPRPTELNPAYDPASARGRGGQPGERGGNRKNRQIPDTSKP